MALDSSDPVLVPLSSLDVPTRGRRLGPIRVVATDVDGTLTRHGALDPEVVRVIAALTAAGVEVVPISGRPAGEVLGLCRYLPGVTRAIAENGLLEVIPDRPPRWLAEPTDQAQLRAAGERLDPGLRLAPDHPFRLGDVAYERDGRGQEELQRLRDEAAALGVCMIWSSVHVHLTPQPPDKGQGLLRFASDHGLEPATILTIGDAPNDEGLFRPGRFGVTVGTADVPSQRAAFRFLPAYVTEGGEAEGFLEVAAALLHR
ncbi:HAD family hydrolase [Paraliomyxa miuraensis]|uniref:HAD family hydrolase n=1 Tax=Paraliomyxa miuraensis TaxID=376150 RepID=UPI00225469D5|nr:HAD family hydrolase [Paraliomyxa miuraensis]MCX4240079.1 Cof-type HAD-IIB family hydrolase [Paraliomyxa miuraensis]